MSTDPNDTYPLDELLELAGCKPKATPAHWHPIERATSFDEQQIETRRRLAEHMSDPDWKAEHDLVHAASPPHADWALIARAVSHVWSDFAASMQAAFNALADVLADPANDWAARFLAASLHNTEPDGLRLDTRPAVTLRRADDELVACTAVDWRPALDLLRAIPPPAPLPRNERLARLLDAQDQPTRRPHATRPGAAT